MPSPGSKSQTVVEVRKGGWGEEVRGEGGGGREGRRPRSPTGRGVQDPTPAAERTWTQLSPVS